jgi:hypothetical protein
MSAPGNNFGQITFGAGTAILTPYATNGPTNPTPLQLPITQDLSIDFAGDMADLYGQDQYPYGIARTKVKIDVKAKFGAIYSALLADLFFGSTPALGQTLFSLREPNTVTSHSATVTHSANFIADCGVINATTGVPYTTVPSAPAVGQYAVSAGVYTFNASDTITTAYITYTYNSSSTGQSATIQNQAMGAMPTFDFKYMNNQFGKNVFLEFFLAVAIKISMPNKNTDFQVLEFDFSCYSQSNGNVYTLSLDE